MICKHAVSCIGDKAVVFRTLLMESIAARFEGDERIIRVVCSCIGETVKRVVKYIARSSDINRLTVCHIVGESSLRELNGSIAA